MAPMKLYTFEELKDETLGMVGTPERDAYEAEVHEAVHSWHVGEAIKAARRQKKLTQDQLAQMMGVKKAQVSRIERGCNPTLSTVSRAFRALGIPAVLTCGDMIIKLC